MSAPEDASAGIYEKMFNKYAAVSTTRDSFDGIADMNSQMDITEFTRFAKDFELTEVLTVAKLKMIFANSNIGDAADDRHAYLNAGEFGVAVQTALEKAHVEFETRSKPVNKGVLALEAELKPKPPPSPRTKKAPKAKAATPTSNEIIASQEAQQLDLVPDSNFQSDGVRVPVSKLWGAIREVESHIQTEEQLKTCIDKLTAQSKEEVARVEKQKAMAVAALERSENELLEYEKAAIIEVQQLTAEVDQAHKDRDLAEEAAEAMKAERAETFRKMKELKKDSDLKVKQARENEEEMSKLLNAANTERDEVYEDARRMSTEKVEQRKRQEESEAKLRAEMASLQEKLEAEIAKLVKEREEADAAAASTLKQVRSDAQQQMDDEMLRNQQHVEELQATQEAAMAALKADYEGQLLAAQERHKVTTEKAAEMNAAHERRFADAEEASKGVVDGLEADLAALRAQLTTFQAELARTKEAKAEAETRLQGDIDRLYDQLNEERERREALALKLNEAETDFIEKRQALQTKLEDMVNRCVETEGKLADTQSELAATKFELDGVCGELTEANATIVERDSTIEELNGLLEESKQREAVLQDKLDAKTREMDETVRGLLSVSADHEASSNHHKALLEQEKSEAGMLRDSLSQVNTELTSEQEAHLAEQEAHINNVSAAKTKHDKMHAEMTLKHDEVVSEMGLRASEHSKAQDELRESHKGELNAHTAAHESAIDELDKGQREYEGQIEKALRSAKAHVDRLTHEMTRLRNERDASLSKNKSYERSIEKLDAHISEQQKQIEDTKAKLAAAEDEIKRLQQDVKDGEKAALDAQSDHEAAVEKLNSENAANVRNLCAEHQTEKESLQSKIHYLEGELSVLQAMYKSANVSIEELEKQLETLREQLRTEEREHVDTQALLAAANAELAATQVKLSDLQTVLDEERVRHQLETDDERTRHRAELEDERNRHRSQVEDERATHESEVNTERTRHECEISDERARHSTELTDERAAHQAEVYERQAAHQAEVYERQAELVEERQRHQAEVEAEAQRHQVEVDEARVTRELLEADVQQLEANKRQLEQTRDELNTEVERLTYDVARLEGLLEDANERFETLERRKELVDKQLSDKVVEVDTLTVEVRTLEDTNAEIAAETHKAITGMTEEMESMRSQFQYQIAKLEADLRRVQMDRDELEASYQFAKDELQVIRTTLNAMEEGSKSVKYITEQPTGGNPTLTNRMNNEWGRVAGAPPPQPEVVVTAAAARPAAPQRNVTGGFARDFRLAHGHQHQKKPAISDSPKQGDIGGSWCP